MATFIGISQSNAHGLSFVKATGLGSRHDFIFLIIMELIMLVLQIVNFKTQKSTSSEN
ncbi:Hypothetical protein ADU73_1565 [Pediococcus damnosus]|nr:Hypothetical protein ADU73_1565 [Pediococcus damnosus]